MLAKSRAREFLLLFSSTRTATREPEWTQERRPDTIVEYENMCSNKKEEEEDQIKSWENNNLTFLFSALVQLESNEYVCLCAQVGPYLSAWLWLIAASVLCKIRCKFVGAYKVQILEQQFLCWYCLNSIKRCKLCIAVYDYFDLGVGRWCWSEVSLDHHEHTCVWVAYSAEVRACCVPCSLFTRRIVKMCSAQVVVSD